MPSRAARRTVAMATVLIGLVGMVGCGPFRPPALPRPITLPDAEVERVERVEQTEQGVTYRVHLTLANPNDEPLPMPLAAYTLEINGVSYTTDTVPDATLPAERALTVRLPGVTEDSLDPGDGYEVLGWMTLDPAGEIKQLFYGLGWPRPRVMFSGRGTVE